MLKTYENLDIKKKNLMQMWKSFEATDAGLCEEKKELCNKFIEAVNKGELTLEDYRNILNIDGEVENADIVNEIESVLSFGSLDIEQKLEQILSMPLLKWKFCMDLFRSENSQNKCEWVEEVSRLRDEYKIHDFSDFYGGIESAKDRLSRTTDLTENGTNKRADNVYDAIEFGHWDAAIELFMDLTDEEINNIQLGEKNDEDVKRIKNLRFKLSRGCGIRKKDILGIEDFFIDQINFYPEYYSQLDFECLQVVCGDEHIENIINALKCGNVDLLYTSKFRELVSYKFGDWIYEEFYNQGFNECFEHSEEFDGENTTEQNTWLSQKGVEIVANKIADIVNESTADVPDKLISAVLEIWNNFVGGSFDSKFQMLSDSIYKKVREVYSEADFADINVRLGQIEEVMAETTTEIEMEDEQQKGQTQAD